jgi:hypothetical protein
MALSSGSQGGEFTSAFGGVAEVHGRTASAAFDANDPNRTKVAPDFRSAHCRTAPISIGVLSCFDGLSSKAELGVILHE